MDTYQLYNKSSLIGELIIQNIDDRIQKLEWINKYIDIPYWLDDINTWLSERIGVGRIHMYKLYNNLGINKIEHLIEISNISSLADTLWVKNKHSTIQWDNINLYRQEFNSYISEYALCGGNLSMDKIGTNRSPEYTTVGSYDKCWKRENGSIVLIKKGLEKYSEGSGNEAFSEYYASRLLEDLLGLKPNRDFIPYSVSKYTDNYYITKCRCFTSERYGMIPISLADVKSYTTLDFLKFMGRLNKYSVDLFRWMVVFDYISVNTDRHVGNIGLIVDNDTLEIKRMAPIFDNNLSFYPKITILDKSFKDITDSLQEKTPKYESSFDIMLKGILTKEMLIQLRKRYKIWSEEGFKKIDGISDERIDIMNKVTRLRVERILDLTIN